MGSIRAYSFFWPVFGNRSYLVILATYFQIPGIRPESEITSFKERKPGSIIPFGWQIVVQISWRREE